MAQILKQSTAVDVLIGPFVDILDGAAAETGESPTVKLSKNGQTLAAKNDVTTPIHDDSGYYNCELDATDTNTVGTLILIVAASATALPVRHEFQVMEEVTYDALFGAAAAGFDANGRVDVGSWLGTAVTTSATTAKPEVDVNSVSDDATAANNAELFFDGTGYDAANSTVGTVTTNTDMRGTDSAALASVCTEARLSELDAATAGKAANQIDIIQTDTTTDIPATLAGLNDVAATDIVSAGAITTSGGAVSSVTAIAAGGITAATLATDTITAAKIAADAITSSELAASAAQKIRDEILPTQNVAFSNLKFLFVAASDHVTPVTGASGTAVTRSIDGGAFGSATGTLAEIGNGIYQFDASQADMNGGIICFRFTGTGGTPGAPDDAFLTIVTGGGV